MIENFESNKQTFKTGDMPAEEFRKYGHQMIDWIADYLKNIDSFPVLSSIKPGDVKKHIPAAPPEEGEAMDNILADIDKIIMPGMTHWNHPDFMAYFNSTASGPGILGELLSGAFNINGMVWKSAPASTELEQMVIDWFRQMLDLPDDFWGIIYDTASVSSMHAIAAARENIKGYQLRQKGLAGRADVPRLKLYCSEHAHSSIEKGAIALGIGIEGISKIPVDDKFRMIPGELEKAIKKDRAEGWQPFCAVATVGTTSTTSIDPLSEIAEVCERENLWLHVDAAHAGVTAMIPEYKHILNGIEKANSMVVNPHKWMFVPIDASVLFTCKPDILKQAFSLVPEYLKTSEDKIVENYMDYGVQLGRRFRSLKLWFVIRYFGKQGIINRLKEHLRLGQQFAKWIDENQIFERMAPTPFSTICFRAHPPAINNEEDLNQLNEKLLNNINATGRLFLTHTKLNGKFVIRLVISGIRTEEKHVKEAWTLIKTKLNEVQNS